jgi:hypothetical protein
MANERITNSLVESAVYPSREFLETNGTKIDEFAGEEATYSYNGQSWYVRWDGTVAPLIEDIDEN